MLYGFLSGGCKVSIERIEQQVPHPPGEGGGFGMTSSGGWLRFLSGWREVAEHDSEGCLTGLEASPRIEVGYGLSPVD
jgi:hypothetical protein